MGIDPIFRSKARPQIPRPRVAAADASRYLRVALALIALAAVLLLSAPAHAVAGAGKTPGATNSAVHKLHRQSLVRNTSQPDKSTVSPYARAAAAHQARPAASGPGFAPTMVQGQGLHRHARRASRSL